MRRIFHHTQAGGFLLKRMSYRQPPASLYEDLPRRFCFERTAEVPRVLNLESGRKVRTRLRRFREHHRFWLLCL